jgi:hypothetical protein
MKRVSLSLAVAVLVVVQCMPARAGLGEPATAVARDRAALRAVTATTTTLPQYDRHDLVTDDGGTIREFSAHDGTVFAVDFAGQALPDLKTMLGTHYDDYLAAARAHRARGGSRHVLTFDADGLVVTIVKLPRGFTGHAHVSALMPAGLRAEDLR